MSIIEKYETIKRQRVFVYDKGVQEIKDKISTITDEFDEYESQFGQDRYTETLQEKQKKLFKQLNRILNG